MKNENLKRWALGLAIAALLIAPAALLARPGSGSGFGPGFMLGRLVERLELSQEQREQIHELIQTRHDEMRPMIEDLMESKRVLADAIHAEALDEEAVRAAARIVADAEVEMAVEKARVVQQVRVVLTQEQRAEAEKLRAEVGDRLEEHGGHHRRGRRWHD